MFKFLLDENFHGEIERGLRRRFPNIDMIRVQDTEYVSADDESLVGIAEREERIILSHDLKTMPRAHAARILKGLPVCGVIMISNRYPVGRVLDELYLIIGASDVSEWTGIVRYLNVGE